MGTEVGLYLLDYRGSKRRKRVSAEVEMGGVIRCYNGSYK